MFAGLLAQSSRKYFEAELARKGACSERVSREQVANRMRYEASQPFAQRAVAMAQQQQQQE